MSGILRRPSPTKEKVKVSSIRGGLQSGKTPTIINHNQNISPNIPQTASYDDSGMGWLSTPKFNTARTLVQKKHEILQTTSFNVNRVAELTPKTKAVVTEKALKKLNIPNGRNVYKQLAPVNVNDSVLGLDSHNQRKRTKPRKSTASNVDPEPVLTDYLRPASPLTYTIEAKKEPNPKNIDSEPSSQKSLNDFANECFLNLRETYDEMLKPLRFEDF